MSVTPAEELETRLAGRLAGKLAGRVQSATGHWAAQVVSWMDLVDLCAEVEDGLLVLEEPSTEALALHDAVLSLGIGCGAWLIHQLETNQGDITASGQTLETLKASLEMLRIFHESRHAEFAPGELEAVQKAICHAAA